MERTNRILKVPVRQFTMKLFYKLLLSYLTNGDAHPWELMRDKAWPYGAILKVPNHKDGEYGYAGLMYDEVRKDSSYKNWLFQHDNMREYLIANPGGMNLDWKTPMSVPDGTGSFTTGRYAQSASSSTITRAKSFKSDSPPAVPLFNFGSNKTCMIGTTVDFCKLSISGHRGDRVVYLAPFPNASSYKAGDIMYIITGSKGYKEYTLASDPVDTGTNIRLEPNGVLTDDALIGGGASTAWEVLLRHSEKAVAKGESTITISNVNGAIKKGTYLRIGKHRYCVTNDSTNEPVSRLAEIVIFPALMGDEKCPAVCAIPDYAVVESKSEGYDWSTKYSIYDAEHFAKDADVVFMGMFKQYEPTFDWNHLVGGLDRPFLDARYIRYTVQYRNSPYIGYGRVNTPPAYPGEGWPVIGSAPSFYPDIAAKSDRDFVYLYFTKTKHNAGVVINCRDYWDMGELGFYTPFATEGEFSFPAFVTSSNSGLLPTCTYDSEGRNSYIYQGFQFDYTHANQSFGRAMPNQAASSKRYPSNSVTQVQVLAPTGNWVGLSKYTMFTEYSRSPFFAGLQEPVLREDAGISSFLYPSDNREFNVVDTPKGIHSIYEFDWDLDNYDDFVKRQNTREYSILPMFMNYNVHAKSVVSGEINRDENYILGELPALYYCSSPVTRYGMYRNGDQRFLVMPNCWVGRKFHINNYFSALLKTVDSDTQKAETERLDTLSEKMNTVMAIGENLSFDLWTDTPPNIVEEVTDEGITLSEDYDHFQFIKIDYAVLGVDKSLLIPVEELKGNFEKGDPFIIYSERGSTLEIDPSGSTKTYWQLVGKSDSFKSAVGIRWWDDLDIGG